MRRLHLVTVLGILVACLALTGPSPTRADTDNVTQPPIFLTVGGRFQALNLTYLLPEAAANVSVIVTDGTRTCTLTMSPTATIVTRVVRFESISSPDILAVSPGCATLPDGTYSVTLSYQDTLLNPAASETRTGIQIDRVTASPTLTSPVASTAYSSTVPVEYSLPEVPLPGSVTLALDGVTDYSLTLGDGQDVTTNIDAADPTSNPNVVTMTPSSAIADGTYTATLSYQDDLGNPAATASRALVTIDTVTQAPEITAPENSTVNGPVVDLAYTLAETPEEGSVTVSLVGESTCELAMTDSVSVSTQIDLDSPATNEFVTASDCATIPSGEYTVRVAYRDAVGNATAADEATDVLLARRPAAPTAPTVTPGAGRVSVRWTAPASDAVAPITGYRIRVRPASSAVWQLLVNDGSTATTATIVGLTNGQAYAVQVAAVSAVGDSPWSASSALVTPRTTPATPAAPTARLTRGKVVLKWTAPANGGAAITDYVVQHRRGSGSWRTATDGVSARTTATITLPRGRYTFRITAVNVAGRSRPSAPSASLVVPA